MPFPLDLDLIDAAATTRAGGLLGRVLRPGDTILLDGPLGAGKTALARAAIQARLGRAEEVPSPSFTLVQTYDATDTAIWHADLYRLSGPGEVAELGLEDAFASAICLVEWPDRLGTPPPRHLRVTLADAGDGRRATLVAAGDWSHVARAFAGWG